MRYIVPLINKQIELEGGDVIRDFMTSFFGEDRFFTPKLSSRSQYSGSQFLNTDISETDQAYNLQIELPGVDKKEIQIDYDKETLIISGNRKSTALDKESSVLRHELFNGEFKREIYVGEVDFDNASAEYKNGILSIRLPKVESEQPKRLTIK